MGEGYEPGQKVRIGTGGFGDFTVSTREAAADGTVLTLSVVDRPSTTAAGKMQATLSAEGDESLSLEWHCGPAFFENAIFRADTWGRSNASK